MRQVILLFLFLGIIVESSAVQHEQLEDNSRTWFYYNGKGEKQFDLGENTQTIHHIVDKYVERNHIIRVYSASEISIFENGKIIAVSSNENSIDIPINPNSKMLTIRCKKGFNTFQSSLVINTLLKGNETKENLRNERFFSNFTITTFLFILLLYGFIKIRNSELLTNHLKLSRALSIRTINESLLKIRILEKDNLQLIVVHAMLIALITIFLLNWGEWNSVTSELLAFESYWEGIVKWLILSVLVLLALLSKSILINLFTTLFRITSYRRVHFYTYIRLTIYIYTIPFLTGLFLYYQAPQLQAAQIVASTIVILMLIRVLLTFIKLMNLERLRILYLFSYLCATEILPYIFLVKTTYL